MVSPRPITPDEPAWRSTAMTSASADPRRLDVWAVVAEFACPGSPEPFGVVELETLIDELAEWQPSGLWSHDRYALQLRVLAPSATIALLVALDCQCQALRSVGLAESKLLRIEVLTAQEMLCGWEESEHGIPRVAVGATLGMGVHCPQVYAATRAMLATTTSADVNGVIDDFVVTIGASVFPGPPHHQAGMTDVELDDGGPSRHATAESLSMAGLLLEQALPNLLVDARRALARIEPRAAQSSPSPLLPPPASSLGETP